MSQGGTGSSRPGRRARVRGPGSLTARAQATSRRWASTATGHCWVLMVNSTAPVSGRRTRVWRSLRSQTWSRPETSGGERVGRLVGLGAEQLVVVVDRQVAPHHRALGAQPVQEGVHLRLELGRRSGAPARGWRPPSGPASRPGASATGSTATPPPAGTAPRWTGAGRGPPAPAVPPGRAGAATRSVPRGRRVGQVAVGGGGRAASQAWTRSSTSSLAASEPGRAANTSSGRSASSCALEGQLVAGALVEDQPVGQIQGVQPHRQPRGPGLQGQVVEPLGAVGAGAGSTGGRPPHEYGPIPAWNVRRPAPAMLSPLCATARIGSAPHGPDRISTDVCAGQCSPEPLGPRSPTSTGAPPGFPSGALA